MITIRKKGKRPYTICANWLNCSGTPPEVLESYEQNKAEAIEVIAEEEE